MGTICHTVPVAMRVRGAVPFHLCQGYEGLYEPVRHRWGEIEAIYALPTQKLVVSPHLVDLIARRFGQRARWIPQPLDLASFAPPVRPRPDDGTFRVLVTGQWEVPVKGVALAFEALRSLRGEVPGLKVIRLSQDAPEAEVASWPDAERHVAVPPAQVPAVYRGVDLFVGPSTEAEGFGLPTVEAMACGVPCVLSDIGAFRALDPDLRGSVRVPEGDAAALADAVRRLARDPETRRRLGRGGRVVVAQFRPERTAEALRSAFLETLGRG